MGMLQEFKEFAMKGNVLDMAVGIIIGGAVGKIISSPAQETGYERPCQLLRSTSE